MLRRRIHALGSLAAFTLAALLGAPAHATTESASGEPLDAIWRQHQLSLDFHSFNVRYSCIGLQHKVSSILQAMGAHRDVMIEVNCPSGALVASVKMLVTVKLPIEASAENVRIATTYTTEQQLVARLRGIQLPSANDLPRFTAQKHTIALTRNRRLHLDSGDCDLLTGMRNQLLPQLGISVARGGFRCYGPGTRTRPLFEVAALISVPTAAVALASQPAAALRAD